MKKHIAVCLLFVVQLVCTFVFAESNIQEKGYSGGNIKISGYIIDDPKVYRSNDSKYESYSFKVAPTAEKSFGDEYIMVTFHTVKWGKTIGQMTYKKGDQVSLAGKYLESKTKSKVNLAGSMRVNDLSYKEVMGK